MLGSFSGTFSTFPSPPLLIPSFPPPPLPLPLLLLLLLLLFHTEVDEKFISRRPFTTPSMPAAVVGLLVVLYPAVLDVFIGETGIFGTAVMADLAYISETTWSLDSMSSNTLSRSRRCCSGSLSSHCRVLSFLVVYFSKSAFLQKI